MLKLGTYWPWKTVWATLIELTEKVQFDRLCSFTEPIEQQSDWLGPIEFD